MLLLLMIDALVLLNVTNYTIFLFVSVFLSFFLSTDLMCSVYEYAVMSYYLRDFDVLW
jgi:hypothetical protein